MTRRDFNESYYEHNCVVTDTEDVLEHDIAGTTIKSRLMRWWFDWFLLSYSNEQARSYFASSHAMKMERYRQYRNYRNRIHPLSKFSTYRDIFMFVIFVVNTVVFHHNTSLSFGQLHIGIYYLGALLEWIIIIDVIVLCQTGYIEKNIGKIILDKHLGLIHYGSTKLFIHVASAIPLQNVLLLRYGSSADCSLCKINSFIVTLKFLSVFGLLRVYEHSNVLTKERKNYIFTHFLKILRINLMGMIIMLYYLDLCDMVSLVYMIRSGSMISAAYISRLITAKYVHPNAPSNYTFFIFNFSRIIKSILLFNLSFQKTKFYLDIITSMVAYTIANLVMLWQILEIHDFLCGLNFVDDKMIKTKQSLDSLVRCRQLPDNLSKKLISYYDYNQSKVRMMEGSNLFLMSLPKTLKSEILLTRHLRLIKRISYFSEWPIDMVEDVVLLLKDEIYLPNDLVAEPFVQSEGLHIVALGELAVYDGQTEIGHLIDGDHFGEISLVTDNEQRTVRVVAITPCVILLLDKTAFRNYMRQYPELFHACKQEILENINRIQRLPSS